MIVVSFPGGSASGGVGTTLLLTQGALFGKPFKQFVATNLFGFCRVDGFGLGNSPFLDGKPADLGGLHPPELARDCHERSGDISANRADDLAGEGASHG